MKKFLYSGLALLFMGMAAFAVTGTETQWQDSGFHVLKLKVGDGTPGVATGDNDAYVEGDLEVDGSLNLAGTTVSAVPLQFDARTEIEICGDATTVNNNTVYYGPSQALVTSATVGTITCNTTAAGSTTEATADAPALQATAFHVLGMSCYVTDPGATLTFTLRSAEAALTPAVSVSIADNILNGTSSVTTTTAVASGATLAVAVASTGDIGTVPFICRVQIAF